MREQCKVWWASKKDAFHRQRSEVWLKQNAYELLCLFPHGGTLLDVGCGNAQLLTYLAPHYDKVIGIDFSPGMLEAARQRVEAFGLKNVHLESGDACQFPASVSHADVILSSHVVQDLDPAEVRLHLQECSRVLTPSGAVGLCGIPWVNLRDWYYSGGVQLPPSTGIRQSLRAMRRYLHLRWQQCRGVVKADGIGCWYGRDEIVRIAKSEGFDCHIVHAWYYEHRFHARLRRKPWSSLNAPECLGPE
jgi:SAM-dependent methyltransferase